MRRKTKGYGYWDNCNKIKGIKNIRIKIVIRERER